MAADYEKASGNKIEYSIIPFVALQQKMISALETGHPPDVISFDGIQTTLVLNAWKGKLADVSDIVAPHEKSLSKTALLSTKLYNAKEKRRAYYAVPYKCSSEPFHVWGSLVEKAGYKMSDVPNKWDERWNWFKPMQAKLRAKGMRKFYSLGIQMTTVGPSDGNNTFHGFLLANGGKGLVTPDGKQHADDPVVREAIIKTITYFTDAYKQGYIPPGAISWNDADDNNAFHAKLILADFDGTLSTELAMWHYPKEFSECVTLGLPLGNDGKPMPAMVGVIPSIEMVVWVAVGGRGALWGAIAGTLLVNFGKDEISSALPSMWLYALGLLFVLVVTFLPEGIAGLVRAPGPSNGTRRFGLAFLRPRNAE